MSLDAPDGSPDVTAQNIPVRRPGTAGRLLAAVAVLTAIAGCASDDTADTGTAATAPTTTTTPTTTTQPPTPVSVPTRESQVEPGELEVTAPEPVEVAYGPDPLHTMDVYVSSGDSLGTLMYIHGGAWIGGSKEESTSAVMLSTSAELRDTASPLLDEVDDTVGQRLILAQIENGWDVVSINYRLATEAPGPGIRAPQLLSDVDRAVRYTQGNAAALGLDMSTFVLTGGSAGGHLALMVAQGAPTEAFKDPSLPADLADVEVRIDGVVGMVAPTDLNTLWLAGGIAPPGQESLLGCTLDDVPAIPGMPPCEPEVVNMYSPLHWSRQYVERSGTLPPAYFSYGGEDTLVTIETQGAPNIEAWAASAPPGQTWVDFPPGGSHNIDYSVNYIALNAWLGAVSSGVWPEQPS